MDRYCRHKPVTQGPRCAGGGRRHPGRGQSLSMDRRSSPLVGSPLPLLLVHRTAARVDPGMPASGRPRRQRRADRRECLRTQTEPQCRNTSSHCGFPRVAPPCSAPCPTGRRRARRADRRRRRVAPSRSMCLASADACRARGQARRRSSLRSAAEEAQLSLDQPSASARFHRSGRSQAVRPHRCARRGLPLRQSRSRSEEWRRPGRPPTPSFLRQSASNEAPAESLKIDAVARSVHALQACRPVRAAERS